MTIKFAAGDRTTWSLSRAMASAFPSDMITPLLVPIDSSSTYGGTPSKVLDSAPGTLRAAVTLNHAEDQERADGTAKKGKENPLARAERRFAQLAVTLPLAVVSEIERYPENDGPAELEILAAQIVLERLITMGIVFVLGSGKRSSVARMSADLARAAAVLSFRPDGITILGKKYVTTVEAKSDGGDVPTATIRGAS